MFWRKTRAAIERFHPVHQGLVWQRTASATLPPAEWNALVGSLARHADTVKRRKWRLPDRTVTVLVPLLRVLCEDVAPDGAIGVTADLRGPRVPGKAGPSRKLPVRRPVRSITEWFAIDPWLAVRAELRDGSVLDLTVTDRVRYRRVHKVNPRGKHKTKTKTKTVQRITARRTLQPGQDVRRPDTPPPPWITVRVKSAKRTVVGATMKLGPAPAEVDQVQWILAVATEPFRWTPPAATVRRTA
ncbi:hypothetical protein NE236_27380 [Actinoallomurus purpureus]|uniref:hypothetical protein n=1 Tax=Actinoallomurus purpureus TaxID=478114 RepID=UPI002091EB0F|nr:hypothetical protein [Actinoallomurus purpureus]MCO6008702.1 hypothetical protein [Actinoallomurus purpureus]